MKYLKPIDLYRQLLKSNKGRLLGVEVAPKHVFTAVSDVNNKLATPLRHLVKTKTRVAELQFLLAMISNYSVSGLVIGYPFEAEMCLQTASLQTRRFVDCLTKTRNFDDMNYTFWDDTLKYKATERCLNRPDRWPFSEMIYDLAAYDTLQGYLEFFNQNKDRATFAGEHGYKDFA